MRRCLIILVAVAVEASIHRGALGQGVANNWIPVGVENYSTPSNWDAGGVPTLSPFEERAVIGTGGTAFLDVATVPMVGGVDVTSGSLEIRRGGTLETGAGSSADGKVNVGPAASLTLGGLSGASAATFNVGAAATLQGAVSVLGPNANFTASSIALSGPLNTTVTAGGSSALKTAGAATLSGPLQLTFNGVTPVSGNSWNIVDAGSISGSFTQVTSNASLNPGYFLVQSKQAGGTNGNVAKISVEAQLILGVNRRTGQARIKNLTAGENISTDAYYITSQSGKLLAGAWSSFFDNGFTAFSESNPSSVHLGELAISGSRSIGANTAVSLGNIFTTEPLFTTASGGDLTFDYHKTGGTTRTALVDYEGPHNNVVLVVNPNGQTYIQNQSATALSLDGYMITSVSGALNTAAWTSLADGNLAWSEGNPSNKHLSEVRLTGSQLFGSGSAAVSLGTAFTMGATKDLVFQFHVAGGTTHTGIVEYEDGVINFGTTPGDFNNNGRVDAADYVVWRKNKGTMNSLPNDNGIGGTIDTAHYNLWRLNFGTIVGSGTGLDSSAVPEPGLACLGVAVFAAIVLAPRGRIRL